MRNFHFPCQVHCECILMFLLTKYEYFEAIIVAISSQPVWVSLERSRKEGKCLQLPATRWNICCNFFLQTIQHSSFEYEEKKSFPGVEEVWYLISENNNENVNQVARRSGSSKVLLKSNRGEREVESLVKVAKLSKNFDRLLTLTVFYKSTTLRKLWGGVSRQGG